MDFVDRLSGRARHFDSNAVFKFTDLDVPVQQHLQKVYSTLMMTLVTSAIGAWMQIAVGLPMWLGLAGFVGGSFWLSMTPSQSANLTKRFSILLGIGMSQGITLGQLISMALDISGPGIILTAFAGTAAIFACFSGAAMLARRRSYLFLGGALSSALSLMLVFRLGTWLMGSGRALAFQAELYLGLLIFVGYVLFDTQMIIERAYAGEKDHIQHAMSLFVDFMAIFVRILVILMQNAEKKDDRKRKRRS
ncbi:hypothetical protein WJX84_010204 [Apatococcus fuscideae]|uniref:Bax inhibitor 1 n=1 Tax=Apatococcus fuscideae TaxID=2026836 RepID=A0AAW1T320_9CHLO